jgi:phage-related protein
MFGANDMKPKNKTLANVLNLGHDISLKPARFHPRAIEFIREQPTEIRQGLGEAIRDLQRGIQVGPPLSRPMPEVAPGAYELRVKDATHAVRVFYVTKREEAVLVFHGFRKQTQKTPSHEIRLGRQRLREVLDGKVESD